MVSQHGLVIKLLHSLQGFSFRRGVTIDDENHAAGLTLLQYSNFPTISTRPAASTLPLSLSRTTTICFIFYAVVIEHSRCQQTQHLAIEPKKRGAKGDTTQTTTNPGFSQGVEFLASFFPYALYRTWVLSHSMPPVKLDV